MTDRTPAGFNVIGVARRRVDGRAKVTGQTIFADDIDLPRMLHCKLLRSRLPHARITWLDVEQARAHHGVHLVLTGADLPIEFGILPVSQDEQALCGDKVRYVGDPVAAVVATDEQTAGEAVELIEVDYEPLRTIADPQEALRYPQPRIHDYGEEGNIHKRVHFSFGNVDDARYQTAPTGEDGGRAVPKETRAPNAAWTLGALRLMPGCKGAAHEGTAPFSTSLRPIDARDAKPIPRSPQLCSASL